MKARIGLRWCACMVLLRHNARINRFVAVGMGVESVGCTTTKLQIDNLTAAGKQPHKGVAYFLPFTQHELTVSRTLLACPKKGVDVTYKTQVTIVSTTNQPDPEQEYAIDLVKSGLERPVSQTSSTLRWVSREPTARLNTVQVPVDIDLEQRRWMTGRPPRLFGLDCVEPQCLEIKLVDEHIADCQLPLRRRAAFGRLGGPQWVEPV